MEMQLVCGWEVLNLLFLSERLNGGPTYVSFLLLALLFLLHACRWGGRWCYRRSEVSAAAATWRSPGPSGTPPALRCLGHILDGSGWLCPAPPPTTLSCCWWSHPTPSAACEPPTLKGKKGESPSVSSVLKNHLQPTNQQACFIAFTQPVCSCRECVVIACSYAEYENKREFTLRITFC